MAKKTRTELSTLAINTNLPDNTQELITPTTERAQLTGERDSVLNYKDDLGGATNAGKFITVATDGESLTMVDEPSGVPDFVTFITAIRNQMILTAGAAGLARSELTFSNADGSKSSYISFSGLDGHFYILGTNSQIQLTNDITFITGGLPSLRIKSDGNINIKSARTDGIVNIQAKDANAYGGLNVSAFGNDNTWLSMTHDGTKGIIGQTHGSGGGMTPLVLRTSDLDRIEIGTSGNVAINQNSLSNVQFFIHGYDNLATTYSILADNLAGQGTFNVQNNGEGFLKANAWTYGSDIKLKENISDVENGIEMVSKMKPKHFDYIDGSKNNLGFIAQDVKKIIPQAVRYIDKTQTTLGLKTDFLVPYLVKAIQEQQTIIENLKARIEKLEL